MFTYTCLKSKAFVCVLLNRCLRLYQMKAECFYVYASTNAKGESVLSHYGE